MPLKLKKSQTPLESVSHKDETEGPWGRINPEPQSVVALRLCKKASAASEETFSYSYRILSSWHWRGGISEEELKIEAGSDLVTVKGRGLDRFVEALDRNALEVLRENPNDAPSEDPILVSAITIVRASSVQNEF